MLQRFEYTTVAQGFTARFPFLAYVGTQASYWTIANLLLVAVVNLLSKIIATQFTPPIFVSLGSLIVVGIFYGVSLGLSDYYLDRNFFRKLSIGKVILIKALGSLTLLFVLLFLLRFVLFDLLIAPSLK